MRARFKEWRGKFDARSLRDRAVIAGLTLLALVLLWQVLLMDPLEARRQNLNRTLQTTRTQISAHEEQIAAVLARGRADPNAANRQRLTQLQAERSELNDRLARRVAGLITPQQMAQLLEAVLMQQGELELVRVSSLAPEPVTPAAEGEQAPKEAQVAGGSLYRHGVAIEFQGSYHAALRYLRALESMPWGFYWEGFDLVVERYPMARVKLTVHTLSFDEGWIGV